MFLNDAVPPFFIPVVLPSSATVDSAICGLSKDVDIDISVQ